MNYTFCAKTDPGLIRRNNEDAVCFDERCGVAVLADGMGGYSAGEVASGMATTLITTELTLWLTRDTPSTHPDDICRALVASVDKANQGVLQAALDNPDYTGMGTTLVVGVFQGDHLFLTHVGDSRCYRLRSGKLTQITKDHSLLQEQLDAGLITRAHGVGRPGRNILTRALGVDPNLPFEVKVHRVAAGDLYLMCSDGLTDMVDDASIACLMGQDNDIIKLASALINLANAKGGRDNIAVILIHVKDSQDKRGKLSRLFVS